MYKIRLSKLILFVVIVSMIATGCSKSREDLLDKDMYDVGEEIVINFSDSDLEMSKMNKFVSISRFDKTTWVKIDSVTLNDGALNYSIADPGKYKIALRNNKNGSINYIYALITVKEID